jgi:HTH-type transcriptional regulator/antitoxin HigA
MELKPIRTNEEYEEALKEIESLFSAEPGTSEGDKLEVLSILVNVYEDEHYPIPAPDPIEAIEYHMERLGMTRKDLEPFIGGPSRVSEILNRKRSLSIKMIRSLSEGLGISMDVLGQAYELNGPDSHLEAELIINLLMENVFKSRAVFTPYFIELLLTSKANLKANLSGEASIEALPDKNILVNLFDKPDFKIVGSDISPQLKSIFSIVGATERTVQ